VVRLVPAFCDNSTEGFLAGYVLALKAVRLV